MNNTSEYLKYEKVSDGTAYFDIPISSSLYKRILDEISKAAPTSTDNFSMHQIGDQKKASFQTNNFREPQTVVSPNPQVLSYIVQAEKEIREKIVSQYESEIRSLIRQDEFLDGETSQSERHMLEAYANGHIDYVTEAIMSVYSSSLNDSHILEGILSMIACVPYESVEPRGQIMAMGLLTNKNLAVRDKAIQCFEKWNSKKGLSYLNNIECSPKWLQRYVDKVIMYIERDGVE